MRSTAEKWTGSITALLGIFGAVAVEGSPSRARRLVDQLTADFMKKLCRTAPRAYVGTAQGSREAPVGDGTSRASWDAESLRFERKQGDPSSYELVAGRLEYEERVTGGCSSTKQGSMDFSPSPFGDEPSIVFRPPSNEYEFGSEIDLRVTATNTCPGQPPLIQEENAPFSFLPDREPGLVGDRLEGNRTTVLGSISTTWRWSLAPVEE